MNGSLICAAGNHISFANADAQCLLIYTCRAWTSCKLVCAASHGKGLKLNHCMDSMTSAVWTKNQGVLHASTQGNQAVAQNAAKCFT